MSTAVPGIRVRRVKPEAWGFSTASRLRMEEKWKLLDLCDLGFGVLGT